ncbi:hypothetical protein SUGI_0014390 [Cryptomeria japonica]|nr:hypothetical protein SUGI_0014390 [Cryptomeria japonica]
MPGRTPALVEVTLTPNGLPVVFPWVLKMDVVKCSTEASLEFIQGRPFIKIVEEEVSATQKSCNVSGSALIVGTSKTTSRETQKYAIVILKKQIVGYNNIEVLASYGAIYRYPCRSK